MNKDFHHDSGAVFFFIKYDVGNTLVVLLVADFKAHTALEQVSGSHSVGCGVEAVAGAVSGLDEVSVVHVLVDGCFEIVFAHSGNV